MQTREHEAGHPAAPHADRRHHSDGDHSGEEQQRDLATGAGRIPQEAVHPGGPGSADGQPATVSAVPSRSTRRAGSARSASQSTAARPLTIAAVEAALASTQLAAATLTVRQWVPGGPAVRGSMMWCSVRPPAASGDVVATMSPGRRR